LSSFRWAGGDVARRREEAGLLSGRCGPGERPAPAVPSMVSRTWGRRDRAPRWAVSIPNKRTRFRLACVLCEALSRSAAVL